MTGAGMERIMAELVDDIEMIGRMGAKSLELGWLVDDPGPGIANWYASAEFRSGTLTTTPQMAPHEATRALLDMLRRDARCAWCGRKVGWAERGKGRCFWRRIDGRWERGCTNTTPTIKERP